MKCPRCGYNNDSGSNFCSRCGLELIKVFGQRRPVAVIFADIKGFTALSEKLDPEELKELIDCCLRRLGQVIQNYEGFVDKFIGDCLMALFGAPFAHEDDPLRAVLAAIDLQKEIALFNNEKRQHLSLAIGINYGLVATGDLGRTGAYTVMGDTVNLAKRLQERAPANAIYVSRSVYENTNNEIVYKSLGKISVKGKREKVAVYLPLRVAFRYSQRRFKEIPLIGRTGELNKLRSALNDVQSGKRRFIGISGEAGIGKTKLVYEFKRHLPANIVIIETKGIEYLAHSPYFILRDLLKKLLGILDNNTPQQMEMKLLNFIKGIGDPIVELKMPLYKFFLSLNLSPREKGQVESMKPEDRIRLINEAILTLFYRVTKKSPLLLILDDCHWIDKETMDFIYKLVETVGYNPIMIIALYRPEFNVENISHQPYFAEIRLKPLVQSEVVEFLKNILNCEQIDEDLFRLLFDKSDAIPFYIYELTLNLLNNNLITIEKKRASLKTSAAIAVPRTIDELIMAKIDRLAPNLREIVNIASVIGEEFSLGLLGELFGQKDQLKKNLDNIEALGIIKSQIEQNLNGEVRYSFTHAITRDVVYNSLLKQERERLHQKIGYALEKFYGQKLHDYYDILADHFSFGGNPQKALYYLERSADRKKDLYLNQEAIKAYHKCLSMISQKEILKKTIIYEKLGMVYELTGNNLAAMSSYKNMGESSNDPFLQSRAYNLQAQVLENLGRYDEAMRLLNEARKKLKVVRNISQAQKAEALSEISGLECWIYRIKGKIKEAEKRGREAISLIKKLKNWQKNGGLKKALAKAYTNLAVVYLTEGNFDQAVKLCMATLPVVEGIGNQQIKGEVYNILGGIYKARGEYEKAIDSFTTYLHISTELGDKNGIGVAYCNLGNVYQNKGELSSAIECHEKYLKISEELGDKLAIGMAHNNIGINYFNSGDYSKALEEFKSYLKISKELGNKQGEAIACGNMGEVYSSQFEYKKAIPLFKKYLRISFALKNKPGIALASYNLGQTYTEIGRIKLARNYLNRSRAIFEELGNKNAIGSVLNALADLKIKEEKNEVAIRDINTALKIAEETGNTELRILCLLNLARIYSNRAPKRSKEIFAQVLKLGERFKNLKLLATIYWAYGKFLKLNGEKIKARKFLKEACRIYKKLGIKKIPRF